MHTRPARWLIAGMAIAIGVAARAEPLRGENRLAQAGAEITPTAIAPPAARPTPRRPVARTPRRQTTVLPQDSAASRARRAEENATRLRRMAAWPVLDVEVGDAQWYGHFHHGRRTASGERYDMYALTAAHRDLPLGSYARVTNIANGRVIIVRINDRHAGPPEAVIDLSRGAANDLGMAARGAALVRIEALNPP
jgi:rare lipoprotein A (peptidoglycan hydrolase)